MKVILHYVRKMDRGGMENYIMNIYRNINREKYQFHFAVHTDEKGDYDNEIKMLGGQIYRFPNFRNNPIKYIKTWKKFWQNNKNNYSIFHFHTNTLANIYAIKEAKSNNFNNIIIHAHSGYAHRDRLQLLHDLTHKKNQKYVDTKKIKCLSVSNKASSWVFGKNDISIINNGIDYEKFRKNDKKKESAKKRLKIPDNYKVIGHIGNFLKVKNHTFLLEVFKHINKENPDTILLLMGDGPEKNNIEEQIKQTNNLNNVIFLGNVPDVDLYINCIDVFIFPSYYEGLPLSLIEAQVNEIPTIYSNSIDDAIEVSNYIIPLSLNLGAEKWAKEALVLFSTLENGEPFYIDEKYNIDNTIKEITDIYDEI